MSWYNDVKSPALAVDERRARGNIQTMAEKAAASGVRFRPHFKTHQSAAVGQWFREAGVEAITVSSLRMARFFAQNGWRDITLAFPVNPRQFDEIAELAGDIELGLLFTDAYTARRTGEILASAGAGAHAWIKIDAGYGRSGIRWDDGDRIAEMSRAITGGDGESTEEAANAMNLTGLLTHAGDTYHMEEAEERRAEFHRVAEKMDAARVVAESASEPYRTAGTGLQISVGDTPGVTAVYNFSGVDEVRPGNFVYFDSQQYHLGSCGEEEIAAAVLCPVVAVYPERGEAVIHGGAVHLSAQSEEMVEGVTMYGYAVPVNDEGWGAIDRRRRVVRISQEHGVVAAEAQFLANLKPGDLLAVLPVHSCLVVDLADSGMTTGGGQIDLEMR